MSSNHHYICNTKIRNDIKHGCKIFICLSLNLFLHDKTSLKYNTSNIFSLFFVEKISHEIKAILEGTKSECVIISRHFRQTKYYHIQIP